MKIFPQKLVDVNYWYMDKVRHDCFIIYKHSENPRIFLIQVYKEDFSYEFTTTCYSTCVIQSIPIHEYYTLFVYNI